LNINLNTIITRTVASFKSLTQQGLSAGDRPVWLPAPTTCRSGVAHAGGGRHHRVKRLKQAA
jgi:hypothetical protein